MDKKIIEYLIIAMVVILLLYGCFSIVAYKYQERQDNITDSITMYHPSSSAYEIVGDTIQFRNSLYDFYNMDVSKLNSSDAKLTNLLNHFANVNQGTVDYKNETCYLLTMEFVDDSGFKYHSILIPIDSFNKDNLSFKNETQVYVFDGNDRGFVVDSAFNSKVVM